jgi:hypothetical protein
LSDRFRHSSQVSATGAGGVAKSGPTAHPANMVERIIAQHAAPPLLAPATPMKAQTPSGAMTRGLLMSKTSPCAAKFRRSLPHPVHKIKD